MDRFPEAFNRFEEVVDVRRIESFRQLRLAFASWAGWKWHDTYMQNRVWMLTLEDSESHFFVQRRPGARIHEQTVIPWRHQVLTAKSK